MNPTFIADPLDPRLDAIRDLKHSDRRPDTGQAGFIIAEGALVIDRLLASRYPVMQVTGFGSALHSWLASNPQLPPNVPVYEVSRETLAQVAGFDLHRGLVAAASRVPALQVSEVLANARTLLVLEGIGNHENIGTLFRSGAGLGADGILFGAACADPLYRRSVRVSMGHVLRLPFAFLEGTTTTWQRRLSQLHEAGFRTVSLTPDPDAVHLAQALVGADGHPVAKLALLVGAEGPGLTEHAMRATHVRARIPMAPGTDSLNLGMAASIALYERSRSLEFASA